MNTGYNVKTNILTFLEPSGKWKAKSNVSIGVQIEGVWQDETYESGDLYGETSDEAFMSAATAVTNMLEISHLLDDIEIDPPELTA